MSRRSKSNRRQARSQNAQAKQEIVPNSVPITRGSSPLHTSAQALRLLRQNKHNPLPHLTPQMLARVLDAFEHGYLREAVLLWEKIAERDDVIASVKPKREKDVSQLDMQVVTLPDSGEDGERHKAILEKFWRSARAVNAYDRNEKGGFRRLVKQMMTAVSFRYAVHHIIWDPRPDGELRATFEFVPLWCFENRSGTLRYLESPHATEGRQLNDGEWMVTVGDGLMIACSIGYLAKRSTFNDWLIFSEKFSVPGVLGRTSAKQGTPEAEAMREAVESFGHDWVALITDDDGTHAEPIKLVQAQGSPQGMPMPAVIERVDRKFAALYRGADLSSMSSGSTSEGTGASLQEKETDILRRDDAETIAETLAEVSRWVIEWHEGSGVEPLARVELLVPVQEDGSKVLAAATAIADRGAKVSASALMDRLSIQKAEDPADALKPAVREVQSPPPNDADLETDPEVIEAIENAEAPESEPLNRFRRALADDLKPLGDALLAAYEAGDAAAMRAALRKVGERMPELAGDAGSLADELGREMAAMLSDGATEEVENAGNSAGAIKGWETRRSKRLIPVQLMKFKKAGHLLSAP